MSSQYVKLPPTGGGGGGAVDSFNGRTGVVVSATNDYGASQIANTPSGNIAATDVQAAIDELDTEKLAANIAQNDKVLGTNSTGDVVYLPNYSVSTATDTIQENSTQVPGSGGNSIASRSVLFEPSGDASAESWQLLNQQAALDNNSSGFNQGTAGTAVQMISHNVTHAGTGDTGSIEFMTNNLNLGNGVDAIDIKGFSYAFGFGTVNANVNLSGPLQGYGFQPNVSASASLGAASYINAFYDFATISCATNSYQGFSSSPTIGAMNNNSGYTGVNINPAITTFTGNSGFVGIGIAGNLGTFGTGNYTGVNVDSTITNVKSAVGININTSNITPYAGVQASLVLQDLTYTADLVGTGGNSITVEYTAGGTAGAEVVTVLGNAISVQIASGVSTATQVKTAIDGDIFASILISVAISGTAGNAQVAVAATNLAGGEDAGTVTALNVIGDVTITGALTYTGALSIGKLSSYFADDIADGGGVPTSFHSMISAPTLVANATVANADTIGLNTASLMTFNTNSTATTNFIGIAALALPAVVQTHTGSSVDLVTGATFAISLDGGSTGGTIDQVSLCRASSIPNGITTITKLIGYEFVLPFGNPGSTTWGLHISDAAQNYIEGSLAIGTSETVTNSSVGLELNSTTKAILNSRMTTAQRNSLTAVNGMQIYNTDTKRLETYENGSWDLSGKIFTQTSSITVANTVTETTLVGSGVGTLTIPANFLQVGKSIRLRGFGYHSSIGGATIRIRAKIGGVTILDTGAHASHNDTDSGIEIIGDVIVRSIGATGTVMAQGLFAENRSTVDVVGMTNTTTTTIDTTVSNAIDLTVEWGTASASNTLTLSNLTVEVI